MARKRKSEEDEEAVLAIQQATMLDIVKQFNSKELKDIGLDRVIRLEKIYGRDDHRVKKAKLEAFFNAYAIVGTVRYAAQIVGINPKAVRRIINDSEYYQERFDLAHEEFSQYLEQTAIIRALTKSDSLLQFLLRANNPRKFSERLRVQALSNPQDDTPVILNFGDLVDNTTPAPNYAIRLTDAEGVVELVPVDTDTDTDTEEE